MFLEEDEEKFMVIMSHTSLDGAKVLSQRLKEKIEKLKFSFRRKITISGGIVEIDDTSTPEKIIKKADLLLYRAKREGKITTFFLKMPLFTSLCYYHQIFINRF